MSDQDVFIFEVNQSNFNTSVVLNSYKIPVLVEFMSISSGPCIAMEATLSRLAREFAGQFVFAKVEIDEQPELKKEYTVQNIPTLKVFKDGEVARTEEGEMGDAELRDLLKTYGVFRQSDELREQARQKHMAGDTMEAISLLTRAIKEDPSNTRVAMDMVQIFLDINELEQARSLYNRLPAQDRESDVGKALQGQLTFKKLANNTEGKEQLIARLQANADDDTRFDLAICYVAEHDYIQAIDLLFDIFEQNPEYKEGAAKEMIINLTNLLSVNEPELAQESRRRMANAVNL